MATPEFGRIPEFNGSSSSWKSWYGRLQFFFEANDIKDDSKKRAHLLTLCGEETYDVVCALVQPKQPSQVTFNEIVQALKAHLARNLRNSTAEHATNAATKRTAKRSVPTRQP